MFYLFEATPCLYTHRPDGRNLWYLGVLYLPSGSLKGFYWPYFAIYPSFFSACFKHDCFSLDGSAFPSVLISSVPSKNNQSKTLACGGGGVVFCRETHQDAPRSSGQTQIQSSLAPLREAVTFVSSVVTHIIILHTRSGSVTYLTVDQQLRK